jgi:hypothetical protein
MNKVNRRQVGKSILGSVLAGAIPLTRASAEVTGQSHVSVQQESVLLKWDSVFPGIWRATLGKPEQHTPVKDRLIPPLDAALQSLPAALLWCPEVRDAVNEEDLLRRLQTAVFSPLAMVNAWYIQNPPWKQTDRDRNNRNEFTQGWEQVRDALPRDH